jgi:hypothetical protein
MSGVIVILTQNTEVRRTYLKTCLYFLFKHYNAVHQHPVIIFHEGDYDETAQREILLGIRRANRELVTFHALDAGDFEVPSNIDRAKLQHAVEARPTPYWRNVKYRLMCRWWLTHLYKYVSSYEFVMRLDDDSIIEEPVHNDLFAWMREKNLNYASNLMHVDCGICCYGMKEFFEEHYPEKHAQLQELFISQEIPTRAVTFHFFRLWLSLTQNPLPTLGNTMTLHQPVMMYNNFFIMRTAFWKQPAIAKTIQAIDANGSIFYARWGDAPLQSLLCMMHSPPEGISRAIFAYSKRMQREAFKGDDGEFHSYMPESYDKTSCMTEKTKPR